VVPFTSLSGRTYKLCRAVLFLVGVILLFNWPVIVLNSIQMPGMSNQCSIFIKVGDILDRTSYRASFHPLDDDVIDCGITFENAGNQICQKKGRLLLTMLDSRTTNVKKGL
jgi:hypothetical protein